MTSSSSSWDSIKAKSGEEFFFEEKNQIEGFKNVDLSHRGAEFIDIIARFKFQTQSYLLNSSIQQLKSSKNFFYLFKIEYIYIFFLTNIQILIQFQPI